MSKCNLLKMLFKQARAGLWPARAWFLKIDPVWIVGMHVCVCVFVYYWRDISLI